MSKKMIRISCIAEIILAIVIYFSINFSFAHDELIMALLKRTGFVSTLLRLTIFIIPGIHLIGGLFGLVFSAKRLLISMALIELISSICLLMFLQGESVFMLWLAVMAIIIAIIYLIGALTFKRSLKNKEFESQ